uniref:FACT complex subunit SSRP1 n=1 Tax=Globodera pallida TaxID=36090 RepID=A0A183CHW6_GLOPA
QLGDWNWGEENEENASEEKDGGEKHSNEYDDDAEAEADWGWEREGGGGASQDDQKGNKGDQKSEESSCNEKREQIKPGDIERKPASTSESNKSIFDNLVDWAWGDK